MTSNSRHITRDWRPSSGNPEQNSRQRQRSAHGCLYSSRYSRILRVLHICRWGRGLRGPSPVGAVSSESSGSRLDSWAGHSVRHRRSHDRLGGAPTLTFLPKRPSHPRVHLRPAHLMGELYTRAALLMAAARAINLLMSGASRHPVRRYGLLAVGVRHRGTQPALALPPIDGPVCREELPPVYNRVGTDAAPGGRWSRVAPR